MAKPIDTARAWLSELSQLVTNNSTATRPGQRRKIEGLFSLTASADLERFDDEQHA
jgi:hypothetical protein